MVTILQCRISPTCLEALVKVTTTRFGELEVDKNDIVTLKEGLLGFEHLLKFFVVDPGDQTLILWFQSIEDSSVAFPIIEPRLFKSDYSLSLLPSELNSLDLPSTVDASVYTILTIPAGAVTEMSANLKAPIIINNKNRTARQIVLQDSKLEVRFKMYKELKKQIMNFNKSDDSIRTRVQFGEVVANKPETQQMPSIEAVNNGPRPTIASKRPEAT